jgi:hypothetical protein
MEFYRSRLSEQLEMARCDEVLDASAASHAAKYGMER